MFVCHVSDPLRYLGLFSSWDHVVAAVFSFTVAVGIWIITSPCTRGHSGQGSDVGASSFFSNVLVVFGPNWDWPRVVLYYKMKLFTPFKTAFLLGFRCQSACPSILTA